MQENTNYKNRLVLIDGHAIIHRTYYALPPMTAKDGTMVNAVYGFTTMLLKVIEDLEPTHLAMGIDVEGPTFRDEMYEEYKEHREEKDQELYDQIPLTHEVAEAFNIPIYSKQGFEADDILGTIAKHIDELDGNDTEVLIVTGDKDMLQLVDEKVNIALIKKGITNLEVYDIEAVKEEFGFDPKTIIDYKALKGDSSDNIPGISGIGDKRSKKLIDKIGGVEEIFEQLEQEDSKLQEEFTDHIIDKLKEGREDAEVSKKLATIKTDVEDIDFSLEDCKVNFEEQKIRDIFTKFEFFSLLNRTPGGEGSGGEKKREDFLQELEEVKKITTEVDLQKLKEEIQQKEVFACKEVLSNEEPTNSNVEGLVLVLEDQPFYIDLSKIKLEKIQNIFINPNFTLVGHNLKRLIKSLKLEDIEVGSNLFDIKIASYLINANSSDHDLDSIVLRSLQIETAEDSNQANLFGRDPSSLAENLYFTLKVKEKFEPKLEEINNKEVFEEIELPLIPILAQMELNGVGVDEDKFAELSREVESRIREIEQTTWEMVDEKFNLSSTKQLRRILYEKLELPTKNIKEGKTGYSTAASELEKLEGEHPIIEQIQQHRKLDKLKNTYIDVFPTLIDEETERIHTNFNQTVTATGRLSSSDPNLQNIPIRSDLGKRIREAFIAKEENKLIAADYSQIELRIVAHLSGDEKLIEIFNEDKDVHTSTAAAIFDIEEDNVNKDQRSKAKEVNYGVLYGMGAYGLASRTDINRSEAKQFIETYFDRFSGVKRFVDKTIEFARENGYAETMFGRRRPLPELDSDNYNLRRRGERMAINMPVQGTQADIIKKAMINIDKQLKNNFSIEEVKMVLQVHDELVFEVNKDKVDKISEMIKQQMENVIEFLVPVEVDLNTGKRWGKLK